MMALANVPRAVCLYGKVLRADGAAGRERLLAYYHPNPFRRAFVRLLIKLRAL